MKKIRKIISYSLLLVLLILGPGGFYIAWQSKDQLPDQVDYIIVMGHQVKNNKPGPLFQERIDLAFCYAQDHDYKKIIGSGYAYNKNKAEGQLIKDQLVAKGLDENNIVVENQARNTWENLNYSFDLIYDLDDGNPTVLIVSSSFHLARIKLLTKRLDKKAYFLASKNYSLLEAKAFLREIFALYKSLVFDCI